MGGQASAATSAEGVVGRVLIDRLAEAYRLATFLLHDRTAAEDIVQEAALLAWERRQTLRDADRAEASFTRIVVNVCRDELRRRGPRPIVIGGADSGAAVTSRGRDLGAALQRLTLDERTVLALRCGQDPTVPRIAELLAIPEGTVKSRLHAALQHLRATIDAERRREVAER